MTPKLCFLNLPSSGIMMSCLRFNRKLNDEKFVIGICIILLRIEITMQMLCGRTNIPSKQVLLLQQKLIKENGEHRENQRPRQKGSLIDHMKLHATACGWSEV